MMTFDGSRRFTPQCAAASDASPVCWCPSSRTELTAYFPAAPALFQTSSSTTFIVTASGDFGVQLVIAASIVVPLAILAVICWWFWRHREE
jgi:hypothetical protein